MTIIVKDLEFNTELDREAMKSILGGGWENTATITSYNNYSSTGWSSWFNSGIPLIEKRYRHRYRTKVVRTRQRRTDTQYRTI